MKKKSVKRILSGVMVLAVSIALCACGGDKNADKDAANNSQETAEDTTEEKSEDSAAGEPTQGGSVVVGMTQDLVSLDPHAVTDAGTRNVVFNLYEGLVKATPAGELAPAVASDYTISDDAKVYTFTLRDGVTFHDGSAVTVDDIKYSIERYAEEQGDSSAFSIVDEVVTPDDKTVEVHLKEANSEFISELTLGIIPASNEDPAGTPVGTGPFKFVSYTPGQNIVLERYDGYWGTPAYLDQVTFKFVADVETAFTELQAGTLDILNYLTADQVSVLSDDFTIVDGSMNLVHALYLNNEGYEVHKFYDSKDALEYMKNNRVDLALLDVMMPEISGFEICRIIREKYMFPVIMLTAKVEDVDKIQGLSLGADDYITKPFNPLELVARVKAQLRRYKKYNPSQENVNVIDFKGLIIDNDSHRCTLYDEVLNLTPIEFSILWYLCKNRGRVITSEELFEAVWKEKYFDSNNTVMVLIRRLREKMHEPPRNPKFIKTVWGVGYQIEE